MNISFALTPQDLHFFYRYHYWSSPAKKWYRIRIIAWYWLFLSLYLLYTYLTDETPPQWNWYIPIMIGIGITFSVLFRLYILNWIKRHANKLVKENPHQDLIGERTLSLTPDGIHVKSALTASTLSYSTILKVEETMDYFFIYINSAVAIVVPKHAFADENEVQRFKQQLAENSIVQWHYSPHH